MVGTVPGDIRYGSSRYGRYLVTLIQLSREMELRRVGPVQGLKRVPAQNQDF